MLSPKPSPRAADPPTTAPGETPERPPAAPPAPSPAPPPAVAGEKPSAPPPTVVQTGAVVDATAPPDEARGGPWAPPPTAVPTATASELPDPLAPHTGVPHAISGPEDQRHVLCRVPLRGAPEGLGVPPHPPTFSLLKASLALPPALDRDLQAIVHQRPTPKGHPSNKRGTTRRAV